MSENILPEQRRRFRILFGGISQTHVVRDETFPAFAHPGMWTRRAYHRQALCGALRACVIGVDAAEWAASSEVPIDRVTCRRCRERWARMTKAPA